MKFEIVENRNRNRHHLETTYKNINCIVVNGSTIFLNGKIMDLLQIKKGSEILFSKSGRSIYIANVTDHYKTGFLLTHKSKNVRYFRSVRLVKELDLKNGYFEIETFPVYDEYEKIDWHKLTLIK